MPEPVTTEEKGERFQRLLTEAGEAVLDSLFRWAESGYKVEKIKRERGTSEDIFDAAKLYRQRERDKNEKIDEFRRVFAMLSEWKEGN